MEDRTDRKSEIVLIRPTMENQADAQDYLDEHIRNGEHEIHGGALLETMPYEKWLTLTLENAKEETHHADWVVADTFFVYRKSDKRLIGMVDIRHTLNDFLASYGGHIGYGVRPLERNKGYAKAILQTALEYAASFGLQEIMLACYKDNVPSKKTILSCGGTKEREFLHTDHRMVEVYWIRNNSLSFCKNREN